MKKATFYIFLGITALLLASCNNEPTAASGDFTPRGGIVNNRVLVGGNTGATAEFSFDANYDWEIVPAEGFVCTPDRGHAGKGISVTLTATAANNSAAEREMAPLDFRLGRTRFVGISVWQEPQVIVADEDKKIYTAANASAAATVKFECAREDFEMVADGVEIIGKKCIYDDYEQLYRCTVDVSSRTDNFSNEAVLQATLQIYIDGVRQGAEIGIWQHEAVRIDKNRVVLSGGAGSQNIFEALTPFAFEVTALSPKFTVVNVGDGQVTVTASDNNTSTAKLLLGEAEVSLKEHPECKARIEVYQRIMEAPQTLLFYFIGIHMVENGSYHRNLRDVTTALKEDILGDSRILVFIQTGKQSAAMYEYMYDSSTKEPVAEKIRDYTMPEHFSQEFLQARLSDMVTYAPAKQYGLIIGSHGRGWLPKSLQIGSSISTIGEIDGGWVPIPGALPTRHLGDTQKTQFDIPELAGAITGSGIKLEYILFDSCYMSNVESAYDLRNATKYIIGSPCEVMGFGFPYVNVMPQLMRNGGHDYNLDNVCREYVSHYQENESGYSRSACSAVIDCSQLEALAAAVKRANAAEQNEINLEDVQWYDGLDSELNPSHIFFDLEDYTVKSCADPDAVQAVMEQMERTVSSRYHTDSFYSSFNHGLNPIHHYCGLSISTPTEYVGQLQQTEWYQATH